MLFEIGTPLVSRGVNNTIIENKEFAKFVLASFKRHCNGDWGDLCDEDKAANQSALKYGERIFSKYDFNGDTSIYIITEWDRSATTVLFPDEY